MTPEELTIEHRRKDLLDIIRKAILEVISDNETVSLNEITSRLLVNKVLVGNLGDYYPYVGASLRSLYVSGQIEVKNGLYGKAI